MKTQEAQTIYKERGRTIEPVNGDLKMCRGLGPFRVRGLAKVLCVTLWSVLAHTIMHFGTALAA